MKFPYRFTPHARLSADPLFAGEVRHVSGGESARPLVSYSQRCLFAVCGGVLQFLVSPRIF